jgi:hypothetical protein
MLRALFATTLLFSLSTTATAQCPGPYCKTRQAGKEAVPGGIGGPFGASGGYVTASPSAGYGGAPPSGGYGGAPPSGGYGGAPPGGGYGGVPAGGGYGGVPPGGGYGGVPPSGGYAGPPAGGWNNNGIVYQNQPNPQISNYCATNYGSCFAVQQVGSYCSCMDAAGNYYNGVAQQ